MRAVFEEKESVIDISTVKDRSKRFRAVGKPDFLVVGEENVGECGSQGEPHS